MSSGFFLGLVFGAIAAVLVLGVVMRQRFTRLQTRIQVLEDDIARERDAVKRAEDNSAAANALIEKLPTPLFLLNDELTVLSNNAAAIDLAGRNLAGNGIAFGFRQPGFLQTIEAAMETGTGQRMQLELPVPIERSFLVQVEPILSSAGPDRGNQIPTLLVMMLDVTQVMRTEQFRVDFVANVSHELRTPLASLIGFIETLLGPARDDQEAQQRFLTIMQEQADRMYRLIADLLSLSQIELDEHSLPDEPVDLRSIAGEVEALLTMKAGERDMRLVLEIEEGLPMVRGDRDQLTQVLQNLMDNAVKYGNPGTEVRVTMKRDETRVAVAISDQGAGIAREHLPRLTERFYRVDAARSRAMGGTGLGLAIVKHILNRHRGKLTIQSEVGEGSTFRISLPASN